MTDEKWETIVDRIRSQGGLISEGSEKLEHGPGTKKFIIFRSSGNTMMLEYVIRPRITGKSVHAPKRIGGDVQVEYTYDDHEIVGILKAYKKNGDRWESIAPMDT